MHFKYLCDITGTMPLYGTHLFKFIPGNQTQSRITNYFILIFFLINKIIKFNRNSVIQLSAWVSGANKWERLVISRPSSSDQSIFISRAFDGQNCSLFAQKWKAINIFPLHLLFVINIVYAKTTIFFSLHACEKNTFSCVPPSFLLCAPAIPIWTVYGELQLHLVQWHLFWSTGSCKRTLLMPFNPTVKISPVVVFRCCLHPSRCSTEV